MHIYGSVWNNCGMALSHSKEVEEEESEINLVCAEGHFDRGMNASPRLSWK